MNFIARLKNLAHILKYRYLEWQWDRVLKKSGWGSWETYFIANDSGYDPTGLTIRECLPGYPHLVKIEPKNLDIVSDMMGVFYDTTNLRQWCNNNCKEYRVQTFFIEKREYMRSTTGTLVDSGLFSKYHDGGNLKIFDLSYVDEILIAGFRNPEDAAMFTLVWG